MYLVALWFNDLMFPGGDPDLIQWSDGRPGSMSEYRQHYEDTRQIIWDDPRWMAMRFYPDVIGTVTWDSSKRRWKVEGRKIGYFWLADLTEDCTDWDIHLALGWYPIRYRCVVVRSQFAKVAVLSPSEGRETLGSPTSQATLAPFNDERAHHSNRFDRRPRFNRVRSVRLTKLYGPKAQNSYPHSCVGTYTN